MWEGVLMANKNSINLLSRAFRGQRADWSQRFARLNADVKEGNCLYGQRGTSKLLYEYGTYHSLTSTPRKAVVWGKFMGRQAFLHASSTVIY
jgi:hypothetical protein